MCGGRNMNDLHKDWTQELPQEDGEYLWLRLRSCQCCIDEVGYVWISDSTHSGMTTCCVYINNENKPLYMYRRSHCKPIEKWSELEDLYWKECGFF